MRYLFSLFFTLILSSSFAQNRKTDSLSSFIHHHFADDTTKVNALNELSRQYLWIDFNRSLQHADQALKLARELNYIKGIATANNLKGFCYWAVGDNELSIQTSMEAAALMEEEYFPTILTESFLMLSRAYSDLEEDKIARYYVDKAHKLSLQTNNWEQLSDVYNWSGVLHSIQRRTDSALDSYTKALAIAREHGIPKVNLPRILSNIAECHLKTDRDLAFKYFNEALGLAKETANTTAEASISAAMGYAYLRTPDLRNAEKYFQSALDLSRRFRLRRVTQNAYRGMVQVMLKQGKTSEALQYQKSYYEVRDSVLSTSKTRQIVELEARHEIDKKEQAIKLLEQEKKIQTLWRNVLVVGVLLILLSSYVIFTLQRSRVKKAHELLEFQQLLNSKLKDIDKLKSAFFANISHEFRTPLTLILAPVENELKKKLSPQGKESLELVKRNANRLLELVNQLLDLSRLEAGKTDLRIKQGDLRQHVQVMAASFDSWAELKQIEFVKTIDIKEQLYWYDYDKFEKIINNLLSNAFKYTPAGGMVSIIMNCSGNNTLSATVTDTGPGIPEDQHAEIFAPFNQRQSAGQQGSGLGLSLVKELIKLYNGTIELKSSPGRGTSFTITIPVSKESFSADQLAEDDVYLSSPYPGEIQDPSRKIRDTMLSELALYNKDSILIVEDNADLREFMSATIQNNNYAVLTASEGKEAVQLAMKFVPSLVLSDLMMPGMDGMELTRKLKEDERTSHIPIILLTAKNESQSRIEGLKTGADDYLTKPFSTEELLARISNLIEQRKKLAARYQERTLVASTPAKELSLDDKFLLKVRTVVESNLDDYTFTVEKLADEIHLSRTQLLRKLKALTGFSPNDFIKDLRLKKAADMIRLRVDTITQIGYAVGFNDQSYFTKCFKKQFGLTPTEFLEQSETVTDGGR